jgi:hypothetical protein
MATWRVVMQARPAGAPTVPAEEIGGDAALIKKHVLRGIVHGQAAAPPAALRRDVSATLLVGVNGFF